MIEEMIQERSQFIKTLCFLLLRQILAGNPQTPFNSNVENFCSILTS